MRERSVTPMIQRGLWQTDTIHAITALLQADERVQALLLKGSLGQGLSPDLWSDVDVTLVLHNGTLPDFFPTLNWLMPLGKIYTYSQSSGPYSSTSRVCFEDFRRIDFVFIHEDDFIAHAAKSEVAVALFSRSTTIDEALKLATQTKPPVHEATPEQFAAFVNDFWFKGMLATSKVMRGDLLIACHLTLALLQDVCVLQMMLRDRKEGTSHHRVGGIGNDFITRLHHLQLAEPYTAAGILQSIKQSSELFDELAEQSQPGYQAQRTPLIEWIDFALSELHNK